MIKDRNKYKLRLILIFFLGIIVGGLSLKIIFEKKQSTIGVTNTNQDEHIEFSKEVYGVIKKNYWDKIEDKELGEIYRLANEKLTGQFESKEFLSEEDVMEMINKTLKKMDEDKKDAYVTELAQMVLTNLKPFGRNGLFGKPQEEALRNQVANIDPSKDLYQILDTEKGVDVKEIETAYQEQKVILEEESKNSTDAAQKLEEVEQAYDVLSKDQSRQIYDQTGAEPTVFSNILPGNIFYIRIAKMSPITFEEFKIAADSSLDKPELNTLILDLKGNIGGAIDTMPFFLGPFLGKGQYAYEFFHQGEYTPYKTRIGWMDGLIKFKKVVVLIDGQTQSSAEVMASALKKYNVGTLVGTNTRGWGTIENTFKLESKLSQREGLSLFLVHSLTVGENGQPIEGVGVAPDINVESPGWKDELFNVFSSREIVVAVETIK